MPGKGKELPVRHVVSLLRTERDFNRLKQEIGMSETEECGTCHFCDTVCNADHFCHGCKVHVCEQHSVNFSMPFGGHDVELHLEENWEDE